MKLSDFKKVIAEWPDHEDAEVWVETGFGLSNYVTEVLRLSAYDVIIKTSAYQDPNHCDGCDREILDHP